jgi:hypothetical protein
MVLLQVEQAEVDRFEACAVKCRPPMKDRWFQSSAFGPQEWVGRVAWGL